MVTIYILECKGGKYYVGKIKSNVYKRIKQHFDGKGAKWTKKYKPIDIVDIRRNKRDYSETLITLEMMKKHGRKNVRGGSLARMRLTKEQIEYVDWKIGDREEKPKVMPKFTTKKSKSSYRAVLLPEETLPLDICRAMKKNGDGRCKKESTKDDQLCDMHRKSVKSRKWPTITHEEMANTELFLSNFDEIPPKSSERKRKNKSSSKQKHVEPPGLHDEGWVIDEELAVLEMMHQFPDSIDRRDYQFFEDKSEAWKLRWLPKYTKNKTK